MRNLHLTLGDCLLLINQLNTGAQEPSEDWEGGGGTGLQGHFWMIKSAPKNMC